MDSSSFQPPNNQHLREINDGRGCSHYGKSNIDLRLQVLTVFLLSGQMVIRGVNGTVISLDDTVRALPIKYNEIKGRSARKRKEVG